jgi:subtilisin-like proprotein convertase family protein
MRFLRRIAPVLLLFLTLGVAIHRMSRPGRRAAASDTALPSLELRASPLAATPEASAAPVGGPAEPVAAAAPSWVSIVTLPKGSPLPNVDPKFPHRLRNTREGIGALAQRDDAILLRNALVDTASSEPLAVPEELRSEGPAGTYIVQAVGTVDAAFRDRLRSVGAREISYVPNNALLVQASPEAAAALAAAPETRAVLPNEPYFKLEPALVGRVMEGRPAPARLMLTVVDGDAAVKAVEALGASIRERQRGPFGELVTAEVPPGSMASLARLPGVTLVEEVHARALLNDRTGFLLGSSVDLTNRERVEGLVGSNVLVNVNDTGIDASHPDLAGRVFSTEPANLEDPIGHGTHVAGTIAGSGASSGSVKVAQGSVADAEFGGRSPSARLFILPIDLDVGPVASDIFLQETYARTNLALNGPSGRTNAPISNNSWGYPSATEYNSISALYDAAVRDALPDVTGDQPILYVFAAGNEGVGGDNGLGGRADSLRSPGNAKNVVTVGALESRRMFTNTVVYDTNGVMVRSGMTVLPDRAYDPNDPSYETNAVFEAEADSDTQVASYSSRGNVGIGSEGEFGRFKPDVIAPGSYILSTRSAQWRLEYQMSPDDDLWPVTEELLSETEPYYRYESGTSMASPAIAGILAQVQEYYDVRRNNRIPVAGYKAILINSAEVDNAAYQPKPNTTINYAGWGRPSVKRSIHSGFTAAGKTLNGFPGASTNPGGTNDQIIGFPVVGRTNAEGLATGESRSYKVRLSNPAATNSPVWITLAWTDPPGNPASAVKLVNDLDLSVTNAANGQFFLGNVLVAGTPYSRVLTATNAIDSDPGSDPFGNPVVQTNQPPAVPDFINNIERIVIPPPVPQEFIVTVHARRVNVNAVQMHPNQVVQDAALVLRSSAPDDLGVVGTVEDVTVTNSTSTVAYTRPPTRVLTNSYPLLRERVGANSPLIGTTNGSTNQWRFYVFTNTPGKASFGGTLTNGSNVAFVTFFPQNLSNPRIEEPDIDLYVSRDSRLTNLVPAAIASAWKSTQRGGQEFIVFTNAPVTGEIYYVGVKSEDQKAGTYGFVTVSSTKPFGSLRPDGNLGFFGIPLVQPIPDGTPDNPGVGLTMAIGIGVGQVQRVWVEQTLSHGNFPDLIGTLVYNRRTAVLNNHGNIRTRGGNAVGFQYGTNITTFYDDLGSRTFPGSVRTDGPGSLADFMGESMPGVWFLQTADDALGYQGRVDNLEVIVRATPSPQGYGQQNEELICGEIVQPEEGNYYPVNVGRRSSELRVVITNIQPARPLVVHIRRDFPPDPADPDASDKVVTLPPTGGLVSLGIRDEPPLQPGRYFVGVFNESLAPVEYCYSISVRENLDEQFSKTLRSGPADVGSLTDAARTLSQLFVGDTRPVADVELGLRLNHLRASDLSVHLVNPQGDRVLVVENRGRTLSKGYGGTVVISNYQHVALTLDPFTTTVGLHVNGVRVASSNVGPVRLPSNQRLSLANDPTRGFSASRAATALDDVGYWRRPLTTNEIREIYADGTVGFGKLPSRQSEGLAALWPFDNNGNDVLGLNDTALLGFSQFVPGQIDTGLRFVGVTAEARTPVLPIDPGLGFTLEGWVQAYPDNRGIVFGAWGPESGLATPALLVGFEPPWGNGPGSVSAVFLNAAGQPVVVAGPPALVKVSDVSTNATYAVFSDRTNLSQGMVKFAAPPYLGTNASPILVASNSFEGIAPGIRRPGTIVDGWTVLTNDVSVEFLGADAQTGSQALALGNGAAAFRSQAATGTRFRGSVQLRAHPASTNPVTAAIYINGQIDQTVDLTTNWVRADFRFRTLSNRVDVAVAATTAQPVPTNGSPQGVVMDTFVLEQLGAELSYLPEESFEPVLGKSGTGRWTLELSDDRGSVAGVLDSWELRLTFMQTNRPVVRLTNGVPYSGNLAPGESAYFRVDVPLEARAATNTVFSGVYLPMLYSDSGIPTGNDPGDVFAPTNPFVVGTNAPPILPQGQRYYITVINPYPDPQPFAVRADLDIGLVVLANGVPFTRSGTTPGYLDYYAFDVSSNALGAAFEIPAMTDDVDLYLARTPVLPRPFLYSYASTNRGTTPEVIAITQSSTPAPLEPGRWFLSVATRGTNSASYNIVASEFVADVVLLTNNVAVTVTNAVTGTMQYFAIDVPDNATTANFQLTELTGDVNLFVRKGLPLVGTNNFDYASSNPGTNVESVAITVVSQPVPLGPGRWYIGVLPVDPAPLAYTVAATISFDRLDVETLFDDQPVARSVDPAKSAVFRFVVPPGSPSVAFEIYNLDADVNLAVGQGSVPGPGIRTYSFPKPGLQPELVLVTTNDLEDLSGVWYLAVGSQSTNTAFFTVRAALPRLGIPISVAPTSSRLFFAPGQPPVVEIDSVPGQAYLVQTASLLEQPMTWVDFGVPQTATGYTLRLPIVVGDDEATFFRVVPATGP